MRRITEPFDAEDTLQMPVGFGGTYFSSVPLVDFEASVYPSNQYRGFVISPALAISWHGFYLLVNDNKATVLDVPFALLDIAGNCLIHFVRDQSTALMVLYKGGTIPGDFFNTSGRVLLGVGTTPLMQGNFYHIQVGYDSIAQTVEIRIDGNTEISATGVTGLGPYYSTMLRRITSTSTDQFAFDSFYINDSSNVDGLNENTWGGVIRMISAVPPADGFWQDWTLDPAGPDGFAMVNQTPHDGDTTIVYSNVDGEKVSFTVAPHGLTAPSEIRAVSARWVVRKVSGGLVLPFFRINATDYPLGGGAGIPQNVGVDYMVVMDRRVLNPDTTLPWALGDTIESVGLESVL